VVDEVVDSVDCQIGSGEQRQALEDKRRKEELLENPPLSYVIVVMHTRSLSMLVPKDAF
jgi:hypothetical protein